ncbi:MAG: hypothetical protein M5R36_26150 [Deltaproteobacteria bacterium]|nr:hypothetical protein [Deltaproteobacteria bacterium]
MMPAMLRRFTRPAMVMILIAALAPSALADKKPRLYAMDKIICTIGTSTITLEQIELEQTVLAHTRDSMLSPDLKTMNVEQIFRELVVRELLFDNAIRMGFRPSI